LDCEWDGNKLQVKQLQAMLQNTLEQAVVATGVYVTWSTCMPLEWQSAIPTASILFLMGRLLFYYGYASGAPSRALGFALTYYPSMIMTVVLAIRLRIKGVPTSYSPQLYSKTLNDLSKNNNGHHR